MTDPSLSRTHTSGEARDWVADSSPNRLNAAGPRTKSQEQRIEDAARVLHARGTGDPDAWDSLMKNVKKGWLLSARIILEAADAPPKPAWPTDESKRALVDLVDFGGGSLDACLREALLADPIVKAAVSCVNHYLERCPGESPSRALVVAVRDAGL